MSDVCACPRCEPGGTSWDGTQCRDPLGKARLRFHVAGAEKTRFPHQARIVGLCGKRGPVRLRLGRAEPRQITFADGSAITFDGDPDDWCHDCLLLFDEHAAAGRLETVAMVNDKTEWAGRGGYGWRGPDEGLTSWQLRKIKRRVEMVVADRLRAIDTDRRRAKA